MTKKTKAASAAEVIETEVVETEVITVAKGKSIGFRAGIKTAGEVVDPNWPEFKGNEKLLGSMLENGSLVKK